MTESYVYQERSSGDLFELLSFFDNSACFKRLKDGIYIAASKPYYEDGVVTLRTAYKYARKMQAIKEAKEINDMYSDYMDKYNVKEISQDIDKALLLSHNNSAIYDSLTGYDNYSDFDLACTAALTIKCNENDYPSDIVQWADKFLEDNELDIAIYDGNDFTVTSPSAFSQFAREVKDRADSSSEVLDLRQQNDLSL
ncbi:MAG: hypothetical protein IJ571_00145 [Ruminococcus sp.]|nr:hypothetical protein [Ruminococcus sp.]